MKNTILNQALLEVFKETCNPISALEIKKKLSIKKLSPNKSSLYRQLEKLEENWFLQSVVLNSWIKHFEVKKENCYHFVCEECKEISCFEDEIISSKISLKIKELEQDWFSINNTNLFLNGFCKSCK